MLEKGTFLERINRFTALLEIDKKRVRVHLPNSGRLKEILIQGVECIVEKKEKGILPYKLIGCRVDKVWVSLDSTLVNRFIVDNKNKLPFLKSLSLVKKEINVNNNRIDFLFKKNNKEIFCEVKSCTLNIHNLAVFPDAKTERGKRHVELLIDVKSYNREGIIVFVAQRKDVIDFAPNSLTHPEFAFLLYKAMFKGIKVFLVVTDFIPEKKKLEYIFYKEISPFNMLVNEYHLWRYPEVKLNIIWNKKREVDLEFEGTTCFHCSFEENLYDFKYFAEQRGFVFSIKNMISEPGYLKVKLLWDYKVL